MAWGSPDRLLRNTVEGLLPGVLWLNDRVTFTDLVTLQWWWWSMNKFVLVGLNVFRECFLLSEVQSQIVWSLSFRKEGECFFFIRL